MKWAAGEKKRLEDELKIKRSEVAEKERLVNEARGTCKLSLYLVESSLILRSLTRQD